MASPDTRRNLLCVDNSVSEYTQIVDAVDATISDVIVFDSNTHTYNDIISMIRNKAVASAAGPSGFKSIGIIQHNSRLPYYQFLNKEKRCQLFSVEENDSTLTSWSEYSGFLTTLKTEFAISYFDLLACALYSDTNWKYVIDALAAQTGVTIRASTDDTGSSTLGGNWYLESHTGVNLKTVYFTDAIDEYLGLLDMLFMTALPAIGSYSNVAVAPSTLAVWGDSLTTTVLPASLSANLVNITKIFSYVNGTHHTIFALNTSGVLYGFSTKAFGTYTATNIVNVQSNSGWIDFFAYGSYIGLLKANGTVGFLTDTGDANGFIYNTTFSVSNAIAAYNFAAWNGDPNRMVGVLDSNSTLRTYQCPRNSGVTSTNGVQYTVTNVARVIVGRDRDYVVLKRDRTIGDPYNEITWTNVGIVYPLSNANIFGLDMSNNLLYQSVMNGYNYNNIGIINAPSSARTNVVTVKFTQNGSNRHGLLLQTNGNTTFWNSFGNNAQQADQAFAVYVSKGAWVIDRIIQASLKADGTLIIRGDAGNNTYSSQPVIDVVITYSYIAFLLNNGNVVLHSATNTFINVVTTNNAVGLYLYGENQVNVILKDGSLVRFYNGTISYDTSVVTYNGSTTQSSTILNSNVVGVVTTPGLQVAAIQSSSSLSSFSKMDLFTYFVSRNNRRINNFNSLNGTYIIDDYRTITLINPFLPTDKAYKLIIPDYQSSANLATTPYSIKSNVTLDDSVAYFITAIDEGEQFTINGNTATTYVLYSPYVYTITTSPTFALTKVTSITTAYNTFAIYAEGGFAGIGNPVLPKPTLSAFYPSGISKIYGDASFNLTDPSSNNLTGAFTYTSSNTNVAIITGGGSSKNITIIGAGTTTITATQASTVDYAVGTITTTLTVALGTPTLTSSTFTVRSSATYGAAGDISFGITTAPTSNNTDVSITYASNNTSVAMINASTGVITPVGFGTTTFTASQSAVANKFNAASVTSNSLSVARGTTTLSRISMSPSISKTFGVDSATFDISVNSASSGAITYVSTNPSCATVNISTGTVTLVAAGQTTITAQQNQTSQYNAPADISSSLVVNRGTTSLSRVSFNSTISKTYGDSPFNVVVSSASTGTKTYTSSDSSCATVDSSSGLVTLVASGSSVITISQAQSDQYNAPADISAVLTVERGMPVLTRSTFPTTLEKTYGDASFNLIVTSTNTDIPVSYTSSAPDVATVNSSTGVVTIISTGATTITASQTQTSRYYAPTSITSVINVSRGNVVLTGFPTDLSKNVIDLSFVITATSASIGAVTYQSSNTSIATINATTGLVTLKGPGTVSLTASQAQSVLYNAPTPVSCVLVVAAAGNALAGQVVSSTQSFAGVNLSGASLVGSNVSNVSFAGAVLSNVNLSGAVITNTNFTGADISGANITDVSFSSIQKLQLLKNTNNRSIDQIQIQDVSASDILSIVPQNSPILQLPNVADLSFKVIIPPTSTTVDAPIDNATITDAAPAFYMPISEGEYFKVNNVKYYISGDSIKNASTNTDISVLTTGENYYRLFGGSVAGVALDLSTYTIQGATLRDILKVSTSITTSNHYQIVLTAQNTIGSWISLGDIDLINYDYFLNFEVKNAWFNNTTTIGFNETTNNPYNYTSQTFPTSSNTGSITSNTYVNTTQAADTGLPPIFICPNYGSFYLANCNMTYKMSGLRQDVTLLQQVGEPIYTHGEGGGYYGGKGTSNTGANWVGCDGRNIYGITNVKTIRLYLPGNNANWGPTKIRLFTGDTQGYISVRLNVSRLLKNL